MKPSHQATTFSTLLFVVALAIALCGCASSDKDDKPSKKYSTLRLFGAANPDRSGRHQMVQIYRRTPITLSVEAENFLDEGYIMEASVIETVGGFSLRIQYDRRGSGLLEIATYRLRNRHIAIHSNFPESRWLAAPIVERQITDGVLIFTPDATREEADRIADGLNRLSKKIRKK